MLEGRDALTRFRYLGTVKISNNDGSMNAAFGNDLAPWRYDEAVAVGLATALVFAGLRGGQDKASVLNGAGADQHVPMRLAGRLGEGGGNGQEIGTGLGQGAIKLRKAQVIANRQTQDPPRELGQHTLIAGRIILRFPIGLAVGKGNIKHVYLVEARHNYPAGREQE